MGDQGDQIDVRRMIATAVVEVRRVEGALCALGAESSRDGIKMYGLVGLDAPGVAEYLRKLAAKLQVVATNLAYLADHADLAGLVAGLTDGAIKSIDDRTFGGLTVDQMLDLLAEGGT